MPKFPSYHTPDFSIKIKRPEDFHFNCWGDGFSVLNALLTMSSSKDHGSRDNLSNICICLRYIMAYLHSHERKWS